MSAPSLTSDSSSLPSRSSDLHDAHSNHHIQSAVSSTSRPSHAQIFKDPEASSEILQLRTKVSKLEQDKFVLGDYAAELQSRIQQLERERMDYHDQINENTDLDPKGEKAQNNLSSIVRSISLTRPSSPTDQHCGAVPFSVPHPRASSSLSAATSVTVKRALVHATSQSQVSSPTPTQLSFPSSTRLRLVPKRNSRQVPPEPIDPFISEPKGSRNNSLCDPTTPTRRRLQAMYGRLSLDARPFSSSTNDAGPSNHDTHEHGLLSDVHPTRIHHSIPSQNSHLDRVSETKRTAFTSKLDSIILTSKLFPLSSSRSKPTLDSAATNHRPQDGNAAMGPFTHTILPSPPHPGNFSLNSPPRQHVKVKVPGKGNKSLSYSLGLEENRHPDVQPRSDERKSSLKSRNRVSFSDRMFSSSSDHGEESDTFTELPGRVWGSWGRKKRSPPILSASKDKRTEMSPSTPPPMLSTRPGYSRVEHGQEPEEKRSTRRRSLAAGCLRFVTGSSERDKPYLSERHEPRVLRRSHSETRRSHSSSHSPPRGRIRSDIRNPATRDKDEKRRITPSRVGSPIPKGRASDLRHGGEELERTNSLRSAGKWGQRGRGFTHELTRRRTIHPMFSFERPGSAGTSTSSSRRADDEGTADGRYKDAHDGIVEWTHVEKPPTRVREVHGTEVGVSSSRPSHAPPSKDNSVASGHTAHTRGRSESVSTHKSKIPMMRTRLGVQTHGTFAFEPAAAVVVPPRSAPHNGGFSRDIETLSRIRRHATHRHAKIRSEPVGGQGESSVDDTRDHVYLKFCEDLKVALGDGEEWASFRKYIRRFDIEVLTAEVLLHRVKKLIEGSRLADQSTKLKLYDRFVSIVHDNLEEHRSFGS